MVVVVVVVMAEDHMVVEEEVIAGKVCVQLVYYRCLFIKEEMNCFCVIFAFIMFLMILFAICSNSNCSYIVHVWQHSAGTIPQFRCNNFFYS